MMPHPKHVEEREVLEDRRYLVDDYEYVDVADCADGYVDELMETERSPSLRKRASAD